MAQLYTTGPCHIYVAAVNPATGAASAAPTYLGTAEKSPHIELVPMYEDVFNSVGGKVPFDKSYQGEVGVSNISLNRFNKPVYLGLAARPRSPLSGAAGVTLGTNVLGDIGTLVLTEGQELGIIFQFPYAVKAAMAAGGQIPGYFFPFSIPIGPDKLDDLGTTPEVLNLTFMHMRLYFPTTQSFILYTTALPAPLTPN